MGNTLGGWARSAQRRKRMEYLRAHPGLAGLPSSREDVSETQAAALTLIVAQMVTDGLYSPRTDPKDIRWGIRQAVTDIRRGVLTQTAVEKWCPTCQRLVSVDVDSSRCSSCHIEGLRERNPVPW